MTERHLSCPRDGKPLAVTSYDDIEIDECGSCGGVWLDKGELEAIQESPGFAEADLVARSTAEPVSASYLAREGSHSAPSCPVCGGEMEAREHGYASQILVDSCIAGCGVWLDKGELQALERFYEENRDNDTLPLHWRVWASLVSAFAR